MLPARELTYPTSGKGKVIYSKECLGRRYDILVPSRVLKWSDRTEWWPLSITRTPDPAEIVSEQWTEPESGCGIFVAIGIKVHIPEFFRQQLAVAIRWGSEGDVSETLENQWIGNFGISVTVLLHATETYGSDQTLQCGRHGSIFQILRLAEEESW